MPRHNIKFNTRFNSNKPKLLGNLYNFIQYIIILPFDCTSIYMYIYCWICYLIQILWYNIVAHNHIRKCKQNMKSWRLVKPARQSIHGDVSTYLVMRNLFIILYKPSKWIWNYNPLPNLQIVLWQNLCTCSRERKNIEKIIRHHFFQ